MSRNYIDPRLENTKVSWSSDRLRQSKDLIRGVVYARYSSSNQRAESIDAQIRLVSEFAEKYGILITAHYIDCAKTATNDKRPQFMRMIQDSAKRQFDVVLVQKLDRFSRSRLDSVIYRQQLLKNKVHLVSVTEYFDEGPESIILESVLEGISEYYSVNLAREVRKGLMENALQAKHTGGMPPLGYDVAPLTKKLIMNEREAQAVRIIFEMYAGGTVIRK